jgi:hypothetical protein
MDTEKHLTELFFCTQGRAPCCFFCKYYAELAKTFFSVWHWVRQEEMQLILFVPPNEELEGTLHPKNLDVPPKMKVKGTCTPRWKNLWACWDISASTGRNDFIFDTRKVVHHAVFFVNITQSWRKLFFLSDIGSGRKWGSVWPMIHILNWN